MAGATKTRVMMSCSGSLPWRCAIPRKVIDSIIGRIITRNWSRQGIGFAVRVSLDVIHAR